MSNQRSTFTCSFLYANLQCCLDSMFMHPSVFSFFSFRALVKRFCCFCTRKPSCCQVFVSKSFKLIRLRSVYSSRPRLWLSKLSERCVYMSSFLKVRSISAISTSFQRRIDFHLFSFILCFTVKQLFFFDVFSDLILILPFRVVFSAPPQHIF